mmetsp:Transcript_15413/g.33238  ORF Transcript_15413/g.33238 Transcript_15413/m.33238 type:complete len:92 (+) Transcript_15413:70-345(+)
MVRCGTEHLEFIHHQKDAERYHAYGYTATNICTTHTLMTLTTTTRRTQKTRNRQLNIITGTRKSRESMGTMFMLEGIEINKKCCKAHKPNN